MIVNPKLLEKYYSGLCTEEEKIAVKKWIKGDIPEQDYPFPGNTDKSLIEERLWSALSAQIDNPHTEENRSKRLINYKRFIAIAASIVMVSAIYLYIQKTDHRRPEQLAAQYKRLIVPFGEKATIILPDQTVVKLNSGTTFDYPVKFTGKNRIVRISGEGFFSVTKNPARPFIVKTANTVTRVLGTKFNLKAYQGDLQTNLVLSSGRVRFSSTLKNGNSLVIYPGEKVMYQNHHLSKIKVDPSAYLDWTSNKLSFDNTPLSEVAEVIQRWYNVKVIIGNRATGSLKLTGSFNNPPLATLLKDLSYTLGVKYRKDKETIIISQ